MDEDISKNEFDELTWDVINKYYNINKGYQLVKHQIESYNDFIEHKLEQIIKGFNNIEINHIYQLEHENFKYILTICIDTPVINTPEISEKDGSKKTMTPNDARQRNFTYSSNLTVDMHITTQTWNDEDNKYVSDLKILKGVNLGKLPIMVKSKYCILNNKEALITSGECKYDYGGYFIVNGNEKVVISQDRISENKTYVFLNTKVSTYSHIAEIRSVQENKLGVPKITTLKLSAKGNQFGRFIRVNIHHIKNDVPLFILFKALGLLNDAEIIKFIVYNLNDKVNTYIANELIGCIEEANNIMCQKDALEYLAKFLNITGFSKEVLNNKNYRISIVRNVLEREFLPHVGFNYYNKALYLGYMVNKLIKCFLGLKEYDDRDSYINKRVDSPGVLMANLFRQYYGKVIKDMKNMIQKEINIGGWKATNKFSNVITKVNIYKIIKSTIIDSGIRYALATGNWGIKNNKNKQGVAQVLNRMTYSATISHMRRINTPIEKSGKLIQPRKLHPTQWGIICPSETPEGASVGLVKNLSMMASITICSNSKNVRDHLEDLGCIPFTCDNIDIFYNNTKVIVNGDIVGIHTNPVKLFTDLKMLKRKGCINIYSGIIWNILNNEICICTEGGRCVRPLYIVDPITNNIRLPKDITRKTWQDLLIGTFGDLSVEDNVIEFMDVEEGNNSMIAMKYNDLFKGNKGSLQSIKYTHLEIHPSLILGVLASSIPFSDHNQAPRNTYQSLIPTTPILMADGSTKMIKDVKVGEEVITFNPITKYPSISKVINQYVRPTNNRIFKITTVSDRVITATEEHKFMTDKGWKEVKDFDENTLLAIMIHPKLLSMKCDYNIILDTTVIIDKLKIDTIPFNKNLININSHDNRLPIIARISGKLLNANIVNKTVKINFNTNIDKEIFKDDAKYIGFEKNVKEDLLEITYESDMLYFFICLDILPFNQIIPKWIMNGSDTIKQEFLAGYEYYNKSLFDQLNIYSKEEYRYDSKTALIHAIQNECLKSDNKSNNIKGEGVNMYVPIKSITEVENCLISDITTESSNHSFIAGDGFMVHNSAQAKQAIGIYASNYKNRYDTMGHILNSPQKPLVRTKMATILNQDKMPNGINAIVAIACYTGLTSC
jgi:DNA-directed RNA polymerase beta subunit